MNGNDQVRAVLDKTRGFWAARILMTGAELDIFTLLGDTPKTARQAALLLSANPRGTEMLLNALVALDVLVKEDETFRVKPGLEKALSSATPKSVIPMLLHMAHMWDSWGKLTEIVNNGKDNNAFEPLQGGDRIQAFINAMHLTGRIMANEVVAKLDPKDHKKLIDVGGGSGVYTIAFLKAARNMRATIFDLPPVIEIAHEKLKEENLLKRVTFAKGDYHTDTLPGGHDLAFLSAIIHANSSDENRALYQKVYQALVPDGKIVIRDYMMSDDHTSPPGGALFAINMLANTPGGGTYSFAETKAALEDTGFKDVTFLHQGDMDSLVVAKKPV
jgi:ubiquinone/menaquinone biosynthesis C-methylase UbiE